MNDAQKRALDLAKSNPVFHIEQIQGTNTATTYQKQIAQHLARFPRVAVRSCHGVGKTWLAARLVAWFLPTFYNSKVLTTAPTGRQVKKLLWSEIHSAHMRSRYPLGGQVLTTEWNITPEWFAIGYSPQREAESKADIASAFQGFHAGKTLFVLDEATGVRKQIWDQLEGMTTGAFYRVFAIANPTSKSSEFYNCFHGPKAKLWKQCKLDCFDSPNVRANNILTLVDLERELERLDSLSIDEAIHTIQSYKFVQPDLLTLQWVMERAKEWSTSHPLFLSKVLAEFPDEDEQAMFTLSLISQCASREYQLRKKITRRCIGVDPARFGTDKTVITVLEDNVYLERIALTKRRTTEVAGTVINMIRNYAIDDQRDGVEVENTVVAVDGTGIGAGVVDALDEAVKAKRIVARVVEVHFGAGPGDPNDRNKANQDWDREHYANLKAKMFDRLAQSMRKDLVFPRDDTYCEVYQDQLPTIHYRFDSKGRLIIESKDEYKRRTGRTSPDESDSLALANHARFVVIPSKYTRPRLTQL